MTAATLVLVVTACSGRPDFTFEPERAAPDAQLTTPSLSIGSLVTPPPGDYRFARLHADGRVELRELYAFDGPGPWLAYVGSALVSPSIARDALATLDAISSASAPRDDRGPCVLAFNSRSGATWRGCAHRQLAQRVLSQIPSLAAPDVAPGCRRRVCQVRLLREEPAVRHERTRGVVQDIVLDENGRLWCARRTAESSGQTITLRIERGRIDSRNAERVFEWLTATVERGRADDRSSPVPEAVMVRGLNSSWFRLRRSQADDVRSRWRQIASKLPTECRDQ